MAVASLGGWRWLRRPAPRRIRRSPCCRSPSTAPQSAYLADGIVEGVDQRLDAIAGLARRAESLGIPLQGCGGRPVPLPVARLTPARSSPARLSRSGDRFSLRRSSWSTSLANAQVWSTAYEVAPAELPQAARRVSRTTLPARCACRLPGAENAARRRRRRRTPRPTRRICRGATSGTSAPSRACKARSFNFAAPSSSIRASRWRTPRWPTRTRRSATSATSRRSATFPVARPYALKALELDPSLAQAHASLAYIKFYFDWDWEGAGAGVHAARSS